MIPPVALSSLAKYPAKITDVMVTSASRQQLLISLSQGFSIMPASEIAAGLDLRQRPVGDEFIESKLTRFLNYFVSVLLYLNKFCKSNKTKQKIVNAFVDLMSEKSWDKITVKEICAVCPITRSTFYQYYNGIYDLLEELESSLLNELAEDYRKTRSTTYKYLPEKLFVDGFDYSPPKIYQTWFDFVQKNRKALYTLIDHEKGDSYFISRLEKIISENLNRSLDNDGLLNDERRSHIVHLFMEIHLYSAKYWIEDSSDGPHTKYDVVSLLNTMRVGACFLDFKSRTDPDFENKIKT